MIITIGETKIDRDETLLKRSADTAGITPEKLLAKNINEIWDGIDAYWNNADAAANRSAIMAKVDEAGLTVDDIQAAIDAKNAQREPPIQVKP